MTRSYIGISTSKGVESFCPETESNALSLARRAYGPRPIRAVCWWAVLEDATAAEVLHAISAGDREKALAAIGSAAVHGVGPVLPSDVRPGLR